ncbi:phage tail tape measure protein, partial [Belliella pelovolcani]|uniref:phage tail tape measure protein n=1 Tax=Belliella pelovolcani TaxID=529505 RepID=UPI003918D5C8
MARKEDVSRVRLEVDGKQGINELGKLEMKAKELKVDIRAAKKGTEEYIQSNKALKEVESRISAVRKELGLSGMTMRQLTTYQRDLRKELSNTATAGTQRYRELQAEIQRVNNTIRQQRAELNGTAGFWNKMSKEVKQFGMLALGYLGATALLGQVQNMVDGSAKLSDALSDVQKTTQLTDKELSNMAKNLKQMDTRTPRKELLGLAEIAGRLGIQGSKDIEGFVRAADKINVALGDVLGDPEKVMRAIGKLTNTFGVAEKFGIEDALIRVGSAINELGMASTASEAYMVEFTKRLGGIAPLAKISIENVLGLGATLDSLGQTSEVSSTALSKLFIGMAKNADKYAKFAKMEVKDFVDLMNTDANEAFLRMLEGVKDNSNGIVELAGTLGELGQDGGRVVGVLGTLANNVEEVRRQQEISNKAFSEGTSVINEFNLKNENMAANLAKVQKWLAQLFVNSNVMNGLNSFVGAWAKWIQIPVAKKLEEERMSMNKLYLQIISTNEGSQDRIKLIDELKSRYPSLLKNINSETVTNQELAAAVKQVNEQLINKIILQEKEESIQDQRERVAKQQIAVFKQEDELREKAIKLSEKYNFSILEGVPPLEQFTDALTKATAAQGVTGQMFRGRAFNDVANFSQGISQLAVKYNLLNNAEGLNNKLLDEKNSLMERLGINLLDEPTGTSFNPGGDDDDPETPSYIPKAENTEKELEKLAKQWEDFQKKILSIKREQELLQMEDEEREKSRISERYLELETELAQHLQNKSLTKEEFAVKALELEELREFELSEVTNKYREKEKQERIDAEKLISEATMEERALAELKIEQHYDKLVELAKKFGIDETDINAQRLIAQNDLAKKYRDDEIKAEAEKFALKKQMAMDFASVATGVMGLVANFSGETAQFDRTMAIAKAAINSGEAIANMIKMFSATSLTPIDLAAKIAAGTGIILANINAAYRTINRTTIPTAPTAPDVTSVTPSKGRGSSVAPRKSFY